MRLILLTAFCLLPTLLAAADWPQFLGPTRDGVATGVDLKLPWPKAGPAVVWERTVGAGFSGPVVAGERLILFHRVQEEEVIECLDPASGKQRWRFAYETNYRDDFGFDEGPRATPVLADEQVFTLGAEGVLHCLDLAGGKKLWRRNLNEEYRVPKGFFGVGTSPLVEGDLVILNVGGREAKAGVVGFNRHTGKEVWRATDHEASYSSPIAATIDGVRYAFVLTRAAFVGLDPATGRVRFSKPFRARINASVNAATPLVLDSHLFISSSYGVGAALCKVMNEQLTDNWANDESLSCHYNTPVRSGHYLFGIDGRQEAGAELRCIEWKTGKVRWSRAKFGCATLTLVGKQVLALTENGDLVAFDAVPEGYHERGRGTVLSKPTRVHPALANGRLFARDEKRMVCLDLKQ